MAADPERDFMLSVAVELNEESITTLNDKIKAAVKDVTLHVGVEVKGVTEAIKAVDKLSLANKGVAQSEQEVALAAEATELRVKIATQNIETLKRRLITVTKESQAASNGEASSATLQGEAKTAAVKEVLQAKEKEATASKTAAEASVAASEKEVVGLGNVEKAQKGAIEGYAALMRAAKEFEASINVAQNIGINTAKQKGLLESATAAAKVTRTRPITEEYTKDSFREMKTESFARGTQVLTTANDALTRKIQLQQIAEVALNKARQGELVTNLSGLKLQQQLALAQDNLVAKYNKTIAKVNELQLANEKLRKSGITTSSYNSPTTAEVVEQTNRRALTSEPLGPKPNTIPFVPNPEASHEENAANAATLAKQEQLVRIAQRSQELSAILASSEEHIGKANTQISDLESEAKGTLSLTTAQNATAKALRETNLLLDRQIKLIEMLNAAGKDTSVAEAKYEENRARAERVATTTKTLPDIIQEKTLTSDISALKSEVTTQNVPLREDVQQVTNAARTSGAGDPLLMAKARADRSNEMARNTEERATRALANLDAAQRKYIETVKLAANVEGIDTQALERQLSLLDEKAAKIRKVDAATDKTAENRRINAQATNLTADTTAANRELARQMSQKPDDAQAAAERETRNQARLAEANNRAAKSYAQLSAAINEYQQTLNVSRGRPGVDDIEERLHELSLLEAKATYENVAPKADNISDIDDARRKRQLFNDMSEQIRSSNKTLVEPTGIENQIASTEKMARAWDMVTPKLLEGQAAFNKLNTSIPESSMHMSTLADMMVRHIGTFAAWSLAANLVEASVHSMQKGMTDAIHIEKEQLITGQYYDAATGVSGSYTPDKQTQAQEEAGNISRSRGVEYAHVLESMGLWAKNTQGNFQGAMTLTDEAAQLSQISGMSMEDIFRSSTATLGQMNQPLSRFNDLMNVAVGLSLKLGGGIQSLGGEGQDSVTQMMHGMDEASTVMSTIFGDSKEALEKTGAMVAVVAHMRNETGTAAGSQIGEAFARLEGKVVTKQLMALPVPIKIRDNPNVIEDLGKNMGEVLPIIENGKIPPSALDTILTLIKYYQLFTVAKDAANKAAKTNLADTVTTQLNTTTEQKYKQLGAGIEVSQVQIMKAYLPLMKEFADIGNNSVVPFLISNAKTLSDLVGVLAEVGRAWLAYQAILFGVSTLARVQHSLMALSAKELSSAEEISMAAASQSLTSFQRASIQAAVGIKEVNFDLEEAVKQMALKYNLSIESIILKMHDEAKEAAKTAEAVKLSLDSQVQTAGATAAKLAEDAGKIDGSLGSISKAAADTAVKVDASFKTIMSAEDVLALHTGMTAGKIAGEFGAMELAGAKAAGGIGKYLALAELGEVGLIAMTLDMAYDVVNGIIGAAIDKHNEADTALMQQSGPRIIRMQQDSSESHADIEQAHKLANDPKWLAYQKEIADLKTQLLLAPPEQKSIRQQALNYALVNPSATDPRAEIQRLMADAATKTAEEKALIAIKPSDALAAGIHDDLTKSIQQVLDDLAKRRKAGNKGLTNKIATGASSEGDDSGTDTSGAATQAALEALATRETKTRYDAEELGNQRAIKEKDAQIAREERIIQQYGEQAGNLRDLQKLLAQKNALETEGANIEAKRISALNNQLSLDNSATTASGGAASNPYSALIQASAAKNKVDPNLVLGIMSAETVNFDKTAVSGKGARGLMQLMPDTAKQYGVLDSFNPAQNIEGGTEYLAYLMKLFHNNKTLVIAAYNAGEGNVLKYGGVPPFKETQDYVPKVLGYMAKGGVSSASIADANQSVDVQNAINAATDKQQSHIDAANQSLYAMQDAEAKKNEALYKPRIKDTYTDFTTANTNLTEAKTPEEATKARQILDSLTATGSTNETIYNLDKIEAELKKYPKKNGVLPLWVVGVIGEIEDHLKTINAADDTRVQSGLKLSETQTAKNQTLKQELLTETPGPTGKPQMSQNVVDWITAQAALNKELTDTNLIISKLPNKTLEERANVDILRQQVAAQNDMQTSINRAKLDQPFEEFKAKYTDQTTALNDQIIAAKLRPEDKPLQTGIKDATAAVKEYNDALEKLNQETLAGSDERTQGTQILNSWYAKKQAIIENTLAIGEYEEALKKLQATTSYQAFNAGLGSLTSSLDTGLYDSLNPNKTAQDQGILQAYGTRTEQLQWESSLLKGLQYTGERATIERQILNIHTAEAALQASENKKPTVLQAFGQSVEKSVIGNYTKSIQTAAETGLTQLLLGKNPSTPTLSASDLAAKQNVTDLKAIFSDNTTGSMLDNANTLKTVISDSNGTSMYSNVGVLQTAMDVFNTGVNNLKGGTSTTNTSSGGITSPSTTSSLDGSSPFTQYLTNGSTSTGSIGGTSLSSGGAINLSNLSDVTASSIGGGSPTFSSLAGLGAIATIGAVGLGSFFKSGNNNLSSPISGAFSNNTPGSSGYTAPTSQYPGGFLPETDQYGNVISTSSDPASYANQSTSGINNYGSVNQSISKLGSFGKQGGVGDIFTGYSVGSLVGSLTGGNTQNAGIGGALGGIAGLVSKANPLAGLGIDIGGSLLGSLFGDHNSQANEPDKYNTQAWGQFLANMDANTASNPAMANGSSFSIDPAISTITGGKSEGSYISTYLKGKSAAQLSAVFGTDSTAIAKMFSNYSGLKDGKNGNFTLNGSVYNWQQIESLGNEAFQAIANAASNLNQALAPLVSVNAYGTSGASFSPYYTPGYGDVSSMYSTPYNSNIPGAIQPIAANSYVPSSGSTTTRHTSNIYVDGRQVAQSVSNYRSQRTQQGISPDS